MTGGTSGKRLCLVMIAVSVATNFTACTVYKGRIMVRPPLVNKLPEQRLGETEVPLSDSLMVSANDKTPMVSGGFDFLSYGGVKCSTSFSAMTVAGSFFPF